MRYLLRPTLSEGQPGDKWHPNKSKQHQITYNKKRLKANPTAVSKIFIIPFFVYCLCDYFPIQNFENIKSSLSSTDTSPVMLPK